jgi:hypothetical protein
VLLLAPSLAAACYSSGAETADARDATGGDNAATDTVPDAGPDASCTMPQYRRLAPQQIQRFEVLPGVLEPVSHEAGRVGRVVRMVAHIETTGAACGEYAGYQLALDPVTRVARVTITVWWLEDALAGPCAPAMAPTQVVVPLTGLTPGTWTVMDGSVGPTGDPVTMTFEVAACADVCSCTGAPENRPPGADCTLDCQCEAGLSCIGYAGLAGTFQTCERSCSDDRDCPPPERCLDTDDGPSRVCVRWPMDCTPGEPCPVGETCACGDVGCACAAATPAEGRTCCRDADCPEGNVCIGEAGSTACGVPCRRDFSCAADSLGEYTACLAAPFAGGTCAPPWE